MTRAADLTAPRRERELETIANGHVSDVLVVGGGITGAGIALDAATRGLDVTLVESRDLAFGTSRWSSKLVHGGLRYLAHGDVAVAWESAVERRHLMGTIAPHLIRPLLQIVPHFADTPPRERLLIRAGLSAADALRVAAGTPRGLLGRSRSLSAEEVLHLVPGADEVRLRGGAAYWDGQLEDDARLVVAVARTAAAHGARILTRTRAAAVSGSSVRAQDALTGLEFDIHARTVIVAAGVWTGQLSSDTRLLSSRGTHVVVDAAALGHPRAAYTVAVPGALGRFVFALPSPDGTVIVGITDVPESGPPTDVPEPPADDISWILEHLSRGLRRPLDSRDVVGAYAGLRPLVAPTDGVTGSADISRRHLVARDANGAWVVTGGKLTTYRRMAQDALDAARPVGAGPCRTERLPLVGAQPYRMPAPHGVPQRLVRRYGAEAGRVAAWAAADQRLLEPLAPGVGVLGVEVVHAVRAEGALDAEDVLERRTRLSSQPAQAAAAADRVADIMAELT